MVERNKILELLEAAKPGEKVILPDGTTYIVENGAVLPVDHKEDDSQKPESP